MRLVNITAVSVLFILLTFVFAQAEVYKSFDSNWIHANNQEVEVTYGGASHFGVSDDHQFTPKVRAKVEPWINSDVTATEMNWFVRAPQTYLAKFFVLTVHTNSQGGFKLTIEGSENLKSGSGASLDTWYAFVVEKEGEQDKSDTIPPESEFLEAESQFDGNEWVVAQGPSVVKFHLWNKIKVDTLSPAEEYSDEFTVTVSCGL